MDCCSLGLQEDSLNDDHEVMARCPIFSDMVKLSKLVRNNHGVTVFKLSASSGFTTGTLYDVQKPLIHLAVQSGREMEIQSYHSVYIAVQLGRLVIRLR